MINKSDLTILLPLIWIIVIAVIAAAFHMLGVPAEMTALIVGAGLTRVKISAKPDANINTKQLDTQTGSEANLGIYGERR